MSQPLELLTELDAVNLMLAAIGESPVNEIDDTGLADAVIALNTLRNMTRTVQNRGWHWNTVDTMVLSPAFPLPGEIVVPAGTIKCRPYDVDYSEDQVLRGTRMYDRCKQTFTFSRSYTYQIVQLIPFEDMPNPARDYVGMNAALRFQKERVSSAQLAQFEQSDVQDAWRNLMRLETESRKTNMLRGSMSMFRIIQNRN